jgi:small subunit ribosomal protein S4
MGDPRRLKKKWSKPLHPWQMERMSVETEILQAYGLKRKKELWKVNSQLKKYFEQTKGFIASPKVTEAEKEGFVSKLVGLGLLKNGSKLDDALNMSLKDLMERRLQTVVVRKNLAKSMDQARQFIIHEHIAVGENKITVPSYMVSVSEESLVRYSNDSQLKNDGHPEISMKKAEKKPRPAPSRFGDRRGGRKLLRRERGPPKGGRK